MTWGRDEHLLDWEDSLRWGVRRKQKIESKIAIVVHDLEI